MGASSERWRVAEGERVRLDEVDASSTAGSPGDKHATRDASDDLRTKLVDLQARLWAEHERSLLVVFQAMDAGGKDGAIKKVFSGVNPQGCAVTPFRAPTEDELDHDFLWRVHKVTPSAGEIGIFNRSHYEDVVAARVRHLVPEDVWRPRYAAIRDFERLLTGRGTTIVKVFLHIDRDEQAARFRKRLDKPHKRWKFRRSDLDDRVRWDDFMDAYGEAMTETSTDACPWYVVPANKKWFRDWAVLAIVTDALAAIDPRFPEPEAGLDDIVIE